MIRHHRLAVTDEQKMFDKCEKLYPQLSYGRCCAVCQSVWKTGVPAEDMHHIMPRMHKVLRFEPLNLLPVCRKCHQLLTDHKIDEPISTKHREWLQRMSQKDIKGYCIAHGMTVAEYYEKQYRKLKDLVL